MLKSPVRRNGRKEGPKSLFPTKQVWKLKVAALGIFFKIQETVTQEACVGRPCSHKTSFSYCGVDTSVDLAACFSFTLYNIYVLNMVYYIQMHVYV